MFTREQLNSLYRYCYTLTADETQSYDLLQTCLERFIKKDTRNVINHIAYVKTIIRNQYIDEYRKQTNYPIEEFDDTVTYMDMDVDSLDKIIASQFQVEAVWKQLDLLEREIMYFWAVEGYTTEELAKLLDMPKGTLLSKIHRLRKRLEQHFQASSKAGEI